MWLKAISVDRVNRISILLNDNGKKESAALASDRVNRGEGVLAVDPLFSGDSIPRHSAAIFAELLAATGDRPLGIEVAQLISLAQWARSHNGASSMRIEATGFRSQVIALIAAALKPGLFKEVVEHNGQRSLRYLLDAPVGYQSAPDLFCLDLFKQFDLDGIASLAAPTVVH